MSFFYEGRGLVMTVVAFLSTFDILDENLFVFFYINRGHGLISTYIFEEFHVCDLYLGKFALACMFDFA